MKNNSPLRVPARLTLPARFPHRGKRRSGMALVFVLGMLVLVLVLVVAFLSSVSTELQSAKRYSSGSDTRALADSAVSLVISQIQDATSTPSLAWASQPGMIRTYDDTGAAAWAYKLYSSDTLRVQGAFNAPASESSEVPANWASSPSLYTDLNKPVVAAGKSHYPILDPRVVGQSASGGAALSGTAASIEGCFVDTASPAVATSSTQPNPIPMPVQWMYVLKSGSLAAMDPTTKRVAAASPSDPIVGRIAFWTDDETCKVNINTASEGTFWDRPWAEGARAASPSGLGASYERDLAASMPVQNEFQRYPGHPAMTSLSVVFPSYGASAAGRKRLYDIIPRVTAGGSEGGTVYVNQNSAPIVPDSQRLFASVDEFYFSTTTSSNLRQANPDGSGVPLNVGDIEKTRFFLTANSRAPEVNLFNKPRITLWPLQIDERNAKDKLIAFCSTIGTKPFYFQRYNTFSSSPANPSSQSPTMDWDLVPRNQELYAYLQSLTAARVPGLGGSLRAKYPESRDQILTEMFDFVRSTVNTISTGTTESPNYYYTPFSPAGFITGQGQVVPIEPPNGTKGFGRFSTITEAALVFYDKTPLTISGSVPAGGTIMSGTHTIATFPSGTMLNNYPIGDMPQDSIKVKGTGYTLNVENTEPRTIGVAVILEPFNPTPGPPPWTGNVRYVLRNMNNLNVGFPAGPLVNMVSSLDSTLNATAQTGLEANLQQPPRRPKTLGTTDPGNPDPQFYPFAASFVTTGTSFNFPGGDIQIDIYNGASRPLDNGDLVQTIHMTFPQVTNLPLPQNGVRTTSSGTTTVTLSHAKHDTFRDYDKRLSRIVSGTNAGKGRWGIAEDGQHAPLPLIIGWTVNPYASDTVRSVEARYTGTGQGNTYRLGDYRLIAGLKNVPALFYEGHGITDPVLGGNLYSGTTASARLVHSLTIDGMPGSSDTSSSNGFYVGAGTAGDPRGKLVAGANYNDPNKNQTIRNSTRPVAPRGLNGAYMSDGKPGDWDNGVGSLPDGPYINLPDLANANKSDAQWSLYYEKGGYLNSAGMMESGVSFSPNRQIASGVAFGSLPSGIDPANPVNSKPWQTLLFGRHPAAGRDHPGFGKPFGAPPYTEPPDHAFLDLFTMPIIEPYAISEPFSTAGKVNMNYQIVPFTYLTRSTAVRAVLKATNIMAIPTNAGNTYKLMTASPPDFRYIINPDEQTGTLKGFEDRFQSGDIFRSASEICDISLVPGSRVDGNPPSHSPSYEAMDSWWENYQLTGDNVREQPYGHIYPRLTTKSNTFTVHVQAQSLKKTPGSPADEFVEGKDQVTGEFRGSFLVERYLDPNSDSLVKADGRTPTNELDPEGMVGPYKFRVVSSKHFAP